MELKKVFAADFETHKIEGRPVYPPRPVGLAIWDPRERPVYHAWGHPCENNSTPEKALRHIKSLYREGYVGIWHNAGFDLDVGESHLLLPWPAEHHDTLILAYQNDPRAPTFSLKPQAELLLGEPPTESNRLRDWIIENVPEAKRAKTKWGAYIALAPGKLVGDYAIGDVRRTYRLFRHFQKTVLADPEQRRGYERERKLTRVLIKMERRGVPVATDRLKKDVPKFERLLEKQQLMLMDRLKVAKSRRDDFKWSGEGFADQLERARVVKEWIMTKPTKTHPEGSRSTGIDSLKEVGVDPGLLHELEVRSQLQTFLSTFMKPWLEQGLNNGGRFYARFNQVRQDYHGGGKLVGTETGRLSMTPNLQNVPRSDKDKRLPFVRDYITPGCNWRGKFKKPGELILVQRDYSQQELRILAHYENGPFLQKYLENPKIDAHTAVGQLIHEIVNIQLERRDTKDLNFGLIYGMGKKKLALKIGRSMKETSVLYNAHLKALPGVKRLREELDALAEAKQPLYTWGGRKYYCEPPRFMEDQGRWVDFAYKLLNLKIQGSAADCTKEAMVNYHESGADAEFPLLLQVHDELLTLALAARAKAAHKALREAMMDVDFRVPMLSDGKIGAISWHQMTKVEY